MRTMFYRVVRVQPEGLTHTYDCLIHIEYDDAAQGGLTDTPRYRITFPEAEKHGIDSLVSSDPPGTYTGMSRAMWFACAENGHGADSPETIDAIALDMADRLHTGDEPAVIVCRVDDAPMPEAIALGTGLHDKAEGSKPESFGIDYSGRNATCNRDIATGIRYGIISRHEMSDGFLSDTEIEYHAACSECGTDIENPDDTEECPSCGHAPDDLPGDWYGDEPSGETFEADGAKGFIDSSGDVWVVSSPYYVRGTFCSPCAPGAVSIGEGCTRSNPDAPKAFALPHDCYAAGHAPGVLRLVSDDSIVPPPTVD